MAGSLLLDLPGALPSKNSYLRPLCVLCIVIARAIQWLLSVCVMLVEVGIHVDMQSVSVAPGLTLQGLIAL